MATKKVENSYTKAQIINSKTLNYNKDVLEIVLEGDRLYTKTEVDNLVNDFLKREAK